MNLQIRDPRARLLARRLAQSRNISMTDAVIEALEAALSREAHTETLATRAARIASALRGQAQPGGHRMSREEIGDMWSDA